MVIYLVRRVFFIYTLKLFPDKDVQFTLSKCFSKNSTGIPSFLDKYDQITLSKCFSKSSTGIPGFIDKYSQFNLSKCLETKLYFHYSGHGTTTSDINKDETTYLKTTNGNQISILNGANGDSCMVCYYGKNLVLMRDDDFYYYLSFLRANQTLIAFSDSCNSGTLFDLCYLNVGNYTNNFLTSDISKLILDVNNKCSCIQSYYPDKLNKTRANILLISGTRDKDYSYEVSIDKKACGLFTYNLCRVLDYGVKNMSLKTFYYLLIACINWNKQIPVLTFSQNLNVDNYKMSMFEYKPDKNTPKPIMKISVTGRAYIMMAQSNKKKCYKKY